MKSKELKVFSVAAILGGVIGAGMPIDAQAAVESYVIKTYNEMYIYNKQELTDDFLNYKIGNTAKLYNDFTIKLKMGNGFYAFRDEKKGFIKYEDIESNFLITKSENKKFSVEGFIESKECKVIEVNWTKKAIVTKEGQVKYITPEDKQVDNNKEVKDNNLNKDNEKNTIHKEDNKNDESKIDTSNKHKHRRHSSNVNVDDNKEDKLKEKEIVPKEEDKNKEVNKEKEANKQKEVQPKEDNKSKEVPKEKEVAKPKAEEQVNPKQKEEKSNPQKEVQPKVESKSSEKENKENLPKPTEVIQKDDKAKLELEEKQRKIAEDLKSVESAKNNLQIGDLNNVIDNVKLSKKAVNDVIISWKSSDASIITDDGIVTRPEASKGDANVILTATLKKGEAIILKKFKVTVKAKEKVAKEGSIDSLKKDTEGNYIANSPKEFYCVVKDALMNLQPSVVINLPNYKFGPKQSDGNSTSDPQYNLDIINEILTKDAGMDFGKPTSQSSIQGNGHTNKMTITFNYMKSVDEVKRQKEATEAAAKKIISEVIKPGMTDVEKELALHDYVVTHADYNMDGLNKKPVDLEDHSAYGVLVLGKGVCESYAKAMHLLLNKVGVECKYVTGNKVEGKSIGGGHAWNMVKLEDGWYNLDATWDDPVSDRVGKSGEKKQVDNTLPVLHTYFNVSDDVLNKDHKRGAFEEKNYPKCTATKYSYDNLNVQEKTSDGLSIEKVANISELDKKILTALQNKTPKVVLKLKNLNMDVNTLSAEVQKVCQDNNLNLGCSVSLQLAGDYLTYNFTF